ncbi:MAG TPA: hypothetical protein VHS78_10405 [Candidatus Elarobacter sp.]|nr:hypothetical protein [Candidatus Elarobacter sp.]
MRSVSSLALVLAGTVVLSACGGGGSHGTLPAAGQQALVPGTPVGSTTSTFTFTFPKPTTSSKSRATASTRKPQYLSSATASITLVVTDTKNAGSNSDIYANVPSALKAVQYFNPANLTDGATLGHCGTDPSNAGNYKCIASFQMPIGIDSVTITSWDQSESSCTKNTSPSPPTCSVGHVLSSQVGTFTTVQGTTNSFSLSLDANVNNFTLSTTSGFCAGAFTVAANQNVPTTGTQMLSFAAAYTDLANKTIVNPGYPVLSVNGHTDDNGGSGYNDAGTGANVNVKVNQSAQTFTVQPTSSSLTSATIAVTMNPPTGDGLTYSKSVTFTVSSGAAPAAGLLAAVEQTNTTPGSMAGQVDLFQMTNPADPTGFSGTPVNPSTITPAGSPSKDVDNPQDMVFDPNGDLLIANGGAGNPDFGNFACIPAGVITSTTPSASSVTIVTSNADDPISIALSSDSSVGIANLPAAAAVHLVEEVLNGTYAEASPTREISNTDVSGEGALNVTALATNGTNPAGSFAVGLSNGANPPNGNSCSDGTTPANSSEVFIRRPSGGSTVINDNNATVVEPLVGYDAADSRLVVLGSGACNANTAATGSTAYLTTWDIDSSTTAVSKSSQFLFAAPSGTPQSSMFTYSHCCIAVSSSGYVAISGTLYDLNTGVGGPIVQVFQPGTGARSTQGAPIPFNGTASANGANSVYCSGANVCFVNSLKFLSATKLLIGLQSDNNTYQGFYLYNVGTTGATVAPCSPGSCYDAYGNAYGNGPVFLDFKHTTNHPLAAAYHP